MHKLVGIVVVSLISIAPVQGGDTAKQIVIIDNAGKEVKLASATFLSGTRRLSWLGKQPAKDDKEPAGLECLAFREEKSTLFKDGILTLIPLTSIRKIDYDFDKKLVTVTVLGASGKDEVLTGATRFVGINKLELQAEADLSGLGTAVTKFRGGDPTGIRGIRFPEPQSLAAATGALTKITADDKEKSVHEAQGLTGLYQVGGKSVLVPALMFKKTVKVELAKIQSLLHVPAQNPKEVSNDFEVTLDDGQKHVLTLLTDTNPQDGKAGQFSGLIGRVTAGYKLFPAHTIAELRQTRLLAPVENPKEKAD